MENLQDMLLEHVVPDQQGELGKIHYSFTDMKIVHVHWPKVTSADGIFVANNGALRLQGKYQLHRTGVLGYTKNGEFTFDLGSICLSIKDNQQATPTPATRHGHHNNHRHRQEPPRDVTCTVGHIKVKFHGGAAIICQFLTSMYIKMYRRHIETQIAHVIKETIKDDRQLLVSALTVMASMNGEGTTATDTSSPPTSPTVPLTTAHTHHNTSTDHTEGSPGRIQRFIDNFKRRSSTNT